MHDPALAEESISVQPSIKLSAYFSPIPRPEKCIGFLHLIDCDAVLHDSPIPSGRDDSSRRRQETRLEA